MIIGLLLLSMIIFDDTRWSWVFKYYHQNRPYSQYWSILALMIFVTYDQGFKWSHVSFNGYIIDDHRLSNITSYFQSVIIGDNQLSILTVRPMIKFLKCLIIGPIIQSSMIIEQSLMIIDVFNYNCTVAVVALYQ